MATKFTRCEGDVVNVCNRVIKAHHPDLHKAGVKVDLVFAFNEDGQAVALHGYPCAAVVKKISYKQRVLGRGDAEITIDQEWWEDASELQQEGLIHHELTHLVVMKDQRNVVKKDAAGRPKLGMRLHDWQLGGFEDTAKAYGKNAPEVKLARDFRDRYGQCVFEFAKGSA